MTRVNVYVTVEARPEHGTFDVYSAQSTLEEAVGWYAQQKGYSSPPTDLRKIDHSEGPRWEFDHGAGGHATVVRYQVPIVETEDDGS